jgi:hypothetical protein
MIVESAGAQSISNPSVPEFTLQLEDHWLKVTAQNQPVIPNGHDTASIFYDIQIKWHESTNWYHKEPEPNTRGYIEERDTSGTTIWQQSTNAFYELLGMSNSHQLDYQIRAIDGYLNSSIMYSSPFGGVDPNSQPVIIVNTSGWSTTQTITIPAASISTSTPTPTSSSTPTQYPSSTPSTSNITPNPTPVSISTNDSLLLTISIAFIVIAILLAIIVLLFFSLRKRRNN